MFAWLDGTDILLPIFVCVFLLLPIDFQGMYLLCLKSKILIEYVEALLDFNIAVRLARPARCLN